MQTDDLIRFIENHTTLILATNATSSDNRRQQIIGMLELAKAAGLDPRLVEYLDHQRDRLI